MTVANSLDIETELLPGTPFEIGNSLPVGLYVYPQVSADVNFKITHVGAIYPAPILVKEYEGTANEFGYWDGNVWRELHSTLSLDGRQMEAIGTHLGHYTFIPRGSGSPLAISEEDILPTEYSLYQNYPNPFNPITKIQYQLPYQTDVNLSIYDILGNEVIVLVHQNQAPGTYNIIWDAVDRNGREVSGGVYFYRIKTKEFSKTKKLIFLLHLLLIWPKFNNKSKI